MAGVYELHRSLQPEEIEKLQADLQAELARGLAHGSVGGDELEAQSEPTTQMSSRHSGPTTQLSSRRAALKVEAVADFESVLTPVHGLPTRIELAGLGDVDEIRCSVFRSRRLQRRQKHCWMEKAFVGWDWASSARKTRECLSSRCSQQRNRRRASTMLVVWRTQASKFRRRRRLVLIFETRNMDYVAGRVIGAWLHLVHLRRKCAHMIGLLGNNKAHSSFYAWAQAHGERKTLQVRIRQCMHMIDRHTILRGVRGWFEMVREKRRRRLRAEKAEQMSCANRLYSHLNAWRTFMVRQRRINHLDGDASHALTYLFQRSCAPVFAAWRKEAKQHMRQDKAHLVSRQGSPTSFIIESINSADREGTPIQRQGPPMYRKNALSALTKDDDTLSRRICVQRVGAMWTLLSSGLIRLNDKEVQEFCTELRPFYLCWLAYYKRRAGNKRCEQALREQRERLRKSAVLLAWRSESKRNRILAQILSKMPAAGNHRLIFKAAFKEWQKIARSKYLWRHLKKVLATNVGNRERSLLLLAFRVLEAKTLVGLHVVQVVARRVEYRHRRLLGWCFCVLAEDVRRGKQSKEVGEGIAAHLRLQVLTGCLILWTRCSATSSDKVETQEGHSQDFPNDCRVLLTTQSFPYGCIYMSAFIRYHRARALSFWNMTVLKQKRDSRLALKTWSALVLVHKMHTRLAELEAAHDLLGIVALEREALELVRDLEGAQSEMAGAIHGVLGLGFHGVGQYGRALVLHAEHKAIAEELGDRAGLATACCNLGLGYSSTGQYARALELHMEHKAIAEELGDRAGVATACCNLGLCYSSTGQYAQALELHAEHKAIAEELGDRAGLATACCNLGLCYGHTRQYARALELHAEHKAIAEELGDRVGVARSCANLGVCYHSMGQYARALELYAEHKAISEELGDRAGVAEACVNLGKCYQSMGQYARALEVHAEHKAIAEELGDSAAVAAACSNLGNCYERMGQYARALELHVEHKAIAEKLGDRAGVVIACGKRMAARVFLHYLLRIFERWRHAAHWEQLKETAVSRRLVHVHHQICADACGNLLDFWKRRVLRRRCLDAKVRKYARKLVERVIESWSWCQRSRSWRRWAVPICVQRHNKLLLQNIMVAWEEEKGDRRVIRHICWKRHRVCKSFAFVWWRQYTQERRFQHWAVRERRLNVSEMVSKFHHLDAHRGVARLGTFPFFFMRARHVHAFLDAHFVLWVSASVMIRRIRLRNERNEKFLCRHKRQSVLVVAWEALLDNAGKINAGKVKAGKDREGQCNTSKYANKWNHVFKFISARVRKQKLDCLVLWSNLPTYNRRLARHIAKRQAKIVSCVFEALIVSRVAAGRVVDTLKKAQYAADQYMDEILVAILSGWKSLSKRKNTLRHVRRKTMWHLQDMKRRACFLVWIVFAKRQRRFASATEAIEQRRAGEVVCDAVGKWSAAVVHWQRLCWAHRTVARRFESLLLRKCIRGWVDVTAGLCIAELLFQQSFDHLQLRVAKELMFLCFEMWAGRARAVMRLSKLGSRLAQAAASHTLSLIFVHWIAHLTAVRQRRCHRRNMRTRQTHAVLTRIFTSWVVMMADSWHASIAATEKANQLCDHTGLLATRYRRLIAEHVHAWFSFVAKQLSTGREIAKGRLFKVDPSQSKLIGQHWFSTARLWRKGALITRRALLHGSFSRLVDYVEGEVVRRRLCTDLMRRQAQARCKAAFGTWTRKARIFSHITDLASLTCRVLVRRSSDSHLVTVTNLDPGKFHRAYYVRERQALHRWRHYAQASRYLLYKHALLLLRLARLSLHWSMLHWRGVVDLRRRRCTDLMRLQVQARCKAALHRWRHYAQASRYLLYQHALLLLRLERLSLRRSMLHWMGVVDLRASKAGGFFPLLGFDAIRTLSEPQTQLSQRQGAIIATADAVITEAGRNPLSGR